MKRDILTKLTLMLMILMLVEIPALAADRKPIKIGLLYGLSGMAAVITRGTVMGHEIAAEEINARGGVLGRKITYVVRDDKLKSAVAVQEFRHMVNRDRVAFIMGVMSSRVALAVSQVAKQMKVLFIDTIAQTAALTGEQGHRYVVRTNTNTTTMGRTAALAAAKQPWKTYYFIGPDYDWGHRVNADFWNFLRRQKEGVEKMGELWPRLGERNFSTQITTLLNAQPEAVFCSLWGGDLIAFVKQANAYGLFDKVRFISISLGDLDTLKPLGPEIPDGVMATFYYAFDMPVTGKEKANAAFVEKFMKRVGYEPKSDDIAGYISTYILAEAIRRAGSTDTEKVIDTLRGGTFDTILGEISIRDFDGQATFGYHVGFTYTNPNYPFKRLKDVIRVNGHDVLRSLEEVEKAREAYRKRGS
jgi:branched-chain amino acid transport system substrate-binding protein